MKQPDWLRYLDHTADEGIVVCAPELETLFERAAWAMVSIVAEPAGIRINVTQPVTATGRDLESLLVNWLSEINVRMQTDGLIFVRFDVIKLTQTELEAQIGGEKINVGRHHLHTEIKAVTYHGLSVRKNDDVWEAQVIFDL